MAYCIYSAVLIFTPQSSVSLMPILRKVNLFSLCMISSPKFFDVSATISSFTLAYTFETLLTSRYHHSVECYPFTVLFYIHLPYGFNLKSILFNVFLYRSYHKMVYSVYLYSTLVRRMYRSFLNFSYLTCSFNCELTLYIMFTKFPSNFSNTIFPLVT